MEADSVQNVWPSIDVLGRVAVYRPSGQHTYPTIAPYHPSAAYPEYPFGETLGTEPNEAYEAVRGSLHLLGLDAERYGTPEWNPLADIIKPDDMVVIKPNMVRDFHEVRKAGTLALITHGSIIRAIVDYVCLAKGGKGGVTICDSPQNDADWDGLWEAFQFDKLLSYYKQAAPDFDVRVYDVRMEAVVKKHGMVVKRYSRPRDPLGYSRINLGDDSEFTPVPEKYGKLYGAEYDISQTTDHHTTGRHEYLVANSFLKADVIINAPKIKTHKKSGITVWIKSVIGICGDKNWLPHHTEGTPSEGGDQFADDSLKRKTEQRVVAATKRVMKNAGPIAGYFGIFLRKMGSYVFGDTNVDAIRSGNWHGNDTIWRTVLDLHKCWIYADKDGKLQKTPQRKFLCIADGIISGEANGPLAPTAVPAGIVVAGRSPKAVDTTCAVIMGFDPTRLRILTGTEEARGFDLAKVPREKMFVASNVADWDGSLWDLKNPLDFEPHFGWVGYLERPGRRNETPPTNGSAG